MTKYKINQTKNYRSRRMLTSKTPRIYKPNSLNLFMHSLSVELKLRHDLDTKRDDGCPSEVIRELKTKYKKLEDNK